MSKLTDEVLQYLTDDIDAIETTCPQGLLRRLSMRVRELEADNQYLKNIQAELVKQRDGLIKRMRAERNEL